MDSDLVRKVEEMTKSEPLAYRAPATWMMWPAAIGILGFGGVVALVGSVVGRGPWPFLLVFIAAIAWMGYNILPAAYEVRVVDDSLIWRAFVRAGSMRLADIQSVRSLFNGSIQEYKGAGGRRFRVAVAQGYQPFVETLSRLHPEIPFNDSGYARFVERVRLPSFPPPTSPSDNDEV